MKRILVIGATGAMGQYLVPELSRLGYAVDGLALDKPDASYPNVTFYQGNAKDKATLDAFLERHYDGIVDFMTYSSAEAAVELPRITSYTDHYIFLSSCRVFNDLEVPVKESSPRLLDSSTDPVLLASDDYCIYKAKEENILRGLPHNHWTIVRPSTTYSFLRYQLVTLEAKDTVGRAFAGKPVIVPIQAHDIPATLCWGGDVAKMIAQLLFNEQALGTDFNVTTNESHPWHEIADYYTDICGLRPVWVDKEDYLSILSGGDIKNVFRWQLEYARLFRRVYDNTKMCAVTGLQQSEFRSLYEGLKHEITRTPKDRLGPTNPLMDVYCEQHGIR